MKHERIRSDHDTNLLRIIACFFVVVIHASYPDGAQAYFFRALGAFSVPVFMMISGYYMLRRQPDPGKLLKKCGRLFLLLLFWSAFYYLYEVITGARSYGGVWALICYLLTEPAHLWYLYAAIALYALTPVLCVFCRAATRQEYRYALVLSFLLGSVLFTALRAGCFPVLETVAEKMKLNDMCGSVFCYLFGGYLQRWGVKRQRFFYILGGAGTLLTVLGTFFAGRSTTGDPLFLSFFAPGALAAAMGVYTGVQAFYSRHAPPGARSRRLIQELAGCTLGIYLMHPAVILALQNTAVTGALPAILIPLRALAVFIFCGAAVWLLRKIPFLRWPVS